MDPNTRLGPTLLTAGAPSTACAQPVPALAARVPSCGVQEGGIEVRNFSQFRSFSRFPALFRNFPAIALLLVPLVCVLVPSPRGFGRSGDGTTTFLQFSRNFPAVGFDAARPPSPPRPLCCASPSVRQGNWFSVGMGAVPQATQ